MINQNPEQKARDEIDKMLFRAGWIVVDKDKIDWSKGIGLAVREYPTDSGPADYVLFIDKKPVGVIEAKKEEEGYRLTVHEDQTEDYAKSKLKYINSTEALPFLYESTGVLTRFTDLRDPKPRSRPVFSFHRPETFREWLKLGKSLRTRLLDIPALDPEGLRKCQINAITNLEKSFKLSKPRALIQMATGSGKTFTAITSIYRLLKHAKAKRVLFLVDTKNLGEQAEQEFMSFIPNDDNRHFTDLYSVQRLKSSFVPMDIQVCISTIQRMYSILRGEELDESAEETNFYETKYTGKEKEREVVYNPKVPIESFDFIVIDECHRSIYNLWRQVLEYFDGFLIGLTATPDSRTFGFFNENIVSEYTHEEAVADGVNVGFDVYIIETEITKSGSEIKAREYIEKREKLTRRKRWQQQDEDFEYSTKDLDRDVVNPSQIRNIIKTFKNKLPEIFPERNEVPKTLIFAKTDSHADDIIQIVREEFGEGNSFCKKITYMSEEDPKSVLNSFRNDFYPRVAVTVDMIATGTDVKPIECLLFMRDVKSKNYFEQMKGRGTRTYDEEKLKQVTPSAKTNKTHFVIIDAIGVTKSLKTDSRPLERKRFVSMKDLLNSVLMGANDEDTFLSLASRLSRLNNEINQKEKEEFKTLANGKDISILVNELLSAFNPHKIEENAKKQFKLDEKTEPNEEQKLKVQEELIKVASGTFNGSLNNFIDAVRREYDQTIDVVNIDTVTFAGWDKNSLDKANALINDFKEFIENHKDEITALKIYYSQPYRIKEVTYKMIKEVLDILKREKPNLAPLHVYQAYQGVENIKTESPKNELIALVSLIRKVTGLDKELTPFDQKVNKNFQKWVFEKQAGALKFNEEQMEWLRMIKDHVISSFHIEKDDLDLDPFNKKGGLGKMYQLFGDKMEPVINEMNEVLVS